jgi:hypothetical protein
MRKRREKRAIVGVMVVNDTLILVNDGVRYSVRINNAE